MLPKNTITKTQYIPINNAGDYIIDNTITPENPATVLGLAFIQGNVASDMELYSGNTLIFQNFALDTGYIEMNFVATGTLKIVKSGNDEAVFVVNYSPDNRTSSTTLDSMTQGDVLISFLLFLLMLGFSFGFLVKCFIKKI